MKKAEIIYDEIYLKFGGSDFHKTMNFVKSIDGRQYLPMDKKWTVPYNEINFGILRDFGFEFDETDLTEEDKAKPDYTLNEEWRKMPIDLPPLKEPYKLYNYQKDALRYYHFHDHRCMWAVDMGLGKTLMSLSAILTTPGSLPALIITPSPVKWGFERDAHKFFHGLDVEVLSGLDSIKHYSEKKIYVVNYELISLSVDKIDIEYTAKNGDKKKRSITRPNDNLLKMMSSNFQTIVSDECHRIKNEKAKVYIGNYELSKNVPNIIAMSGTPMIKNPKDLFNNMNILKPKVFPNRYAYLNRYCGPEQIRIGRRTVTQYNGATNQEELHYKLRNNGMLVMTTDDAEQELPDVIRTVLPLELSDEAKYMAEREKVIAEIKSDKRLALTLFERLKQLTVKFKMKQMLQYIKDALENEQKILVFAVHQSVVDELYDKLGGKEGKAVKYNGTVSTSQKQKARKAFIEDPEVRVFIANIGSAGTGLDGLQEAVGSPKLVIFAELEWSDAIHRQGEKRLARTGHTGKIVNSVYLVGHDSIEQEIMEKIDNKTHNVKSVMGGHFDQEEYEEDLLTELMNKYIAEAV